MRKFYYLFALCICFIALISCSSSKSETTSLSDRELEEFIKSHDLNVTAKQVIGNKFTVIMFENANNMGFYTAYLQDGEIKSSSVISDNNTDTSPISMGGVATGVPFVTISINNEELIKNTHKIKIVWDDGQESIQTVNNRSALIIPYDNDSFNVTKSCDEVYLLDENGNIIHEKS
ncbi:hypothetical protein [Cytobacillus praedii]|uniref:hypothetical protein n=1 Tax=Cytobacillus praedii TaxID=1742358 RepID=UPI002E1CBF42|nr:hypothetical protein [Cytobacillus praedii]